MDIPIPVYLPFLVILAAVLRPDAAQLRRWRRLWLIAVGRWVVRSRYRVAVEGLEHLPESGGVLLIANHVSYADAAVLQVACRRPIRFLALDRLQENRWLGPWLRWFQVVPVSPQRATAALKEATRCLKAGDVVCIFPEGMLSYDGRIAPLRGGFERIAKLAGVPVLPVHLDGLWGSRLSPAKNLTRWPWHRRHPVRVTFTPSLPVTMTTPDAAHTAVAEAAATSFDDRAALQESLGAACVRHLCRRPSDELAVDYGVGVKRMTRGMALAVAATLAQELRRRCPEARVGIVLPPGLAGLLTNLAVVLAGKVPVNLNYTAGRAALESAIAQAGLRTMISAEKVREMLGERFPDFPWLENTLDVRELLLGLPKWQTAVFLGLGRLRLGWAIRSVLGLPRRGGHAEAALLFTSGSEGAPKGAILSHRNLIANCEQVRELAVIPQGCKLLCNLPIFHSFGFTVQLWVPIFTGARAVFTPSPLDFKLAAKAIAAEGAEVLLGTPTFFRPYLNKVSPEQLATVRLAIAGAEKTPAAFHEKWREVFPKVTLLEGYGLTETAPVAALNLPDIAPTERRPEGFIGTRAGSVGRPLAGMVARVVDVDSGLPLPTGATGILQLKGANIFEGYLGQPEKTAAMLRPGGWLHTGDLARIDSDGFIFIEGRLTRFSKIAGEMVPHGTIETALQEALGHALDQPPRLAVAARQDAQKGEVLVVLTTETVAAETIREALAARGHPNLWVPKVILHVPEIPLLATGKLDLKALRDLATAA